MPALVDDPTIGFHHLTNPQAARRQLTFSLTIVAMLAVGILAAAVVVDDPPIARCGSSILRAILEHQASDRALARDPRH